MLRNWGDFEPHYCMQLQKSHKCVMNQTTGL